MDRTDREPTINLELSDSGATIVHVRGELDLATVDRFRSVLTQAASGNRAIVVDLRRCSFIDSVSIGAMLAAQRDPSEQEEAGQTRMAAVANGVVARALQMVGADLVALPVCPTIEAALESVGAGSDRLRVG